MEVRLETPRAVSGGETTFGLECGWLESSGTGHVGRPAFFRVLFFSFPFFSPCLFLKFLPFAVSTLHSRTVCM